MRLDRLVVAGVLVALIAGSTVAAAAEPSARKLRAGIIGLDTSHVVAFTKVFNAEKPTEQPGVQKYLKIVGDPRAADDLNYVRVVAAFPGGSPDIPSSADRVAGFTEQIQKMGAEIVGSIPELLAKVDVVLLESVDGRPHLEQARPVIKAGKRLFIDKPMAASLTDALEIFRLAKAANVPCFSASSLRYSSEYQALRKGTSPFGKVKSCVAWSPMSLEPHHPDLFWYGIHGVETLFTIMGPGCVEVTRVAPDKVDGRWADGRKGSFTAKKGYGAEVEGTLKSGETGKYEGYEPLLVEIARFFRTGVVPVDPGETLEILAFMEAADESKRQNGAPVSLAGVMEKARKEIAARKP